jgi:siroheme synthase-like protein
MSRRPACPISLYVSDRKVVIAGDGDGADERAARFADAGAQIVRVGRAAYRPALCEGAFAVVAHDPEVGFCRQVAADARAAGCLAYAHDLPDISDFAMPALVRRGPLKIAISTDAAAPALARRLREQLEPLFSEPLDALLAAMERRRDQLAPGERGQLYDMARRVRLEGRLLVDEGDDA